MDTGIGRFTWPSDRRVSGFLLVRRCNGRGKGGHRGLGGTVVDDPPHTHTRVRTTRLGWKELNHPSMGLGWHVRIGASLSTKGPRDSGVV